MGDILTEMYCILVIVFVLVIAVGSAFVVCYIVLCYTAQIAKKKYNVKMDIFNANYATPKNDGVMATARAVHIPVIYHTSGIPNERAHFYKDKFYKE